MQTKEKKFPIESERIKKALFRLAPVLYALLTLWGALCHEMWLDEAQAWVIVRDVPLAELPDVLRAEGHPPLWYAVLYPFVKLGFPAERAPLISWAFMTAGAAVLWFKLKFPVVLKCAVLGSSGFLYINSVMLRSYCMIPLLLFLILWIYPARRRHGVLYGLLIALLANTHIMVCGIVGVLGIWMLTDLFAERRDSSGKENAGKLIGLMIAGAGVLVLIASLYGSISANPAVSHYMGLERSSLLLTVSNTVEKAVDHSLLLFLDGIPNLVLMIAAKFLLLELLIWLRHWRRAFAAELGFLVFYIVTCGFVWYTLPNRAVIFMLSFVFAFGLAQSEKPVFQAGRVGERLSTPWLGKLYKRYEAGDRNAEKNTVIVLTILFGVSVIGGAKFLYRDIVGNFSGARDAAGYITESLEEDAVIVALEYGLPEVSLYAPEARLYCVGKGNFEPFAIRTDKTLRSAEEVKDDLAEYEHRYMICYNYALLTGLKPLFIGKGEVDAEGNLPYIGDLAVCEYDEELIDGFILANASEDEEGGTA